MEQAITIEQAKEFFTHYQNFLVDMTNKKIMDYVSEMQDDLECEIDYDYNNNKAIILIP